MTFRGRLYTLFASEKYFVTQKILKIIQKNQQNYFLLFFNSENPELIYFGRK
jgi:hypothetical protein